MLRRHWKIICTIFSQIIDIIAIAIILFFILYLKKKQLVDITTQEDSIIVSFIVFTILYLLSSAMLGLHRGIFHLNVRLQLRLVFRAFLSSSIISLAVISFFPEIITYPKVSLLFLICIPTVLILTFGFFPDGILKLNHAASEMWLSRLIVQSP